MNLGLRPLLLLVLLAASAAAQGRRPFVRASGEATVSATPDVVHVSMSVTTQGATAQEAADSNATATTRVITALKQLVGAKGDVRTIGYSVFPVQRTTNGVTSIALYQATNSVQATADDLNQGGRIIDTGAQAGATSISGISFGLKDYAPTKRLALQQATTRAKANAEAIASGLNARVGTVVSVEESSAVRPVTDARLAAGGVAAGSVPTPIEAGLVTVSASVVLEADLN